MNTELETRIIHAGAEPDVSTGALSPPIYQTSTYVQQAPGEHLGYEYTRSHNPTRTRLEDCLANLEQARFSTVTASGLAATDLVFRLVYGGTILCGKDVYAGTLRLLLNGRAGVKTIPPVDTTNLQAVARAIKTTGAKLLWFETPGNPLLSISDIKKLSALCHSHGTLCVVDNTFASPYFQNPLALGADIVVHSLTKYINGHGDIVGGCAVTDSEELHRQLWALQNTVGPSLSPFDSWLTLRGLRTLALRMQACERNALKVAEFLEADQRVATVFYPGLATHPQHELAKRQMRGFGGMLSFVPKADLDATKRIASSTKLFKLAESLGGVESLICMPLAMTHTFLNEADLPRNLLRLSVGIEATSDLVNDLDQALTTT